MQISHFSNSGNITKYIEHPDGGIVGEALLFYEGTHIDNQRRSHEVPPERINLLASNTNVDFNQGRDIPVMIEHNRKLTNKDGSVARLGKMASAVSCRPIEEKDLINPRLTNLIGKLGAFAQVHILDKLEAVKNKTISPISAGIDPVNNKFIEISAVADPSLAGAALLFSSPYSTANFSGHGMMDYGEAKEKIEAWEKPHQELQKMFDIFLGTLQAIAVEQEREVIAFNPNNLKRKALEQFTEDLIDSLDISMEDEEQDPNNIYADNPYDSEVITPQFSQEDLEVAIFAHPRKKYVRLGAN